jgi:Methyltransferase FkbM domain
VLCVPLDAIPIPGKVRLVKIDTEGHDLEVLIGMESLLRRDQPMLIVEGSVGSPLAAWLSGRGYMVDAMTGSYNIVATPPGQSWGACTAT